MFANKRKFLKFRWPIPGIAWKQSLFTLFAYSGVFIMVSNVYLYFFRQINIFPKQFQELANGIAKILLCLQTVVCLLWFVMFIYIFFRQNKLCVQAIPGIGKWNFENFAVFANSGVFIMVSNVYFHFFRQNKVCFQAIPGIG